MSENGRKSNSNIVDDDGFTLVVGRRNRKKIVPTSEQLKQIVIKKAELKTNQNSNPAEPKKTNVSKQIDKSCLSNSSTTPETNDLSKKNIEIADTKSETNTSPVAHNPTKPIDTNKSLRSKKKKKSKKINQEKDTKLLSTIVSSDPISTTATTTVTESSETTSISKEKSVEKDAISDQETSVVSTIYTSPSPIPPMAPSIERPIPVFSPIVHNTVQSNSFLSASVPIANIANNTNEVNTQPDGSASYVNNYGYNQIFQFQDLSTDIYIPVVTEEISYGNEGLFEGLPNYEKIFSSRGYLYYNSNNEISISDNICSQVEYYFSDENLQFDRFLRQNMNSEGFVPITLIASFKKINVITNDINLIIHAVKTSTKLEVNQQYQVRRISNPSIWVLASVPLIETSAWFPNIPPAPLCANAKN